MGLFEKIFRPDKAKESQAALRNAEKTFQTLTAYRPTYTSWSGKIYESEIVRAAIDARARHISKLKIECVGTANPSLQSKLAQGPNQWQTWSQLLYRTSTILDCTNNAFLVPVFDDRMIITGIATVLPTSCSLMEYKGEPWLRYKFHNGDVGAVELRKCAILTKHQYERDFFGDSNKALHETMQLIHIQNEGIEEAVKNTSTFRFMAELSNFSDPDDVANERKRFTALNLSSESEAGGFLLFPNTYRNVKQIDVKPYTVDAGQMAAIRQNVFNYFGVNEEILQNKAYGDAWSAFYEGAVEPFAIQLSEVMSKMLFSEGERARGSHVIATSNRLQYLSNADKLNVSSELLDRGIFSINDVREIWNLAPVDGGDARIIRGEYYTTDEKLQAAPAQEENDEN